RIGFEHVEALPLRYLRRKAPAVVDRRIDLEVMRAAELIVLAPMPGSDMDQPRPRVHRDEGRLQHRSDAIDPGMPRPAISLAEVCDLRNDHAPLDAGGF